MAKAKQIKLRQIKPGFQAILPPILAVFFALLVGAGLILIAGANPVTAYTALFQESLTTEYGFGNTLSKTTPLLLTGSGVLVALRVGLFNLGGEGQIYLGGLGSVLVGLYIQGLPSFIHLPLALIAGFFCGGFWALIAAYLKVFRGVNEVLSTLLLNYIAQNLISYLVSNPLKAPDAPSPFSPLIPDSARLPIILPQTQAHAGIFLGLFIAIILSILFAFTAWGYQIDAVGQNPQAARYAGISVNRTLILTMIVSGGLAGFAGSSEVLGLKYRLFENFSPGYGFDAVAIALLSRGSPLAVILISLFFGTLRSGANVMQRTAGVPITIIYAIQGLVLVFLAISLAINWKKTQPI
ncbi:MAG: ABC transporter permease [Cyanobacteriota bacterium]|nr:ABC transporter permease [Cyanobacteriota bacterium]